MIDSRARDTKKDYWKRISISLAVAIEGRREYLEGCQTK